MCQLKLFPRSGLLVSVAFPSLWCSFLHGMIRSPFLDGSSALVVRYSSKSPFRVDVDANKQEIDTLFGFAPAGGCELLLRVFPNQTSWGDSREFPNIQAIYLRVFSFWSPPMAPTADEVAEPRHVQSPEYDQITTDKREQFGRLLPWHTWKAFCACTRALEFFLAMPLCYMYPAAWARTFQAMKCSLAEENSPQ